ncbi:ABC transporter substrate-binding protein [Rhodococcus sp. NPDC076796]|uniref:ABC transporter substrate-binding protein n=1 Tax=Rhodococcus sp. NPDC076796 TaxID=3154859 RepID=UPI002ADC62C8|nr:ABC transporter substrate-binding protein [Rhodococcus sp. (in: high G+C Gram-positive bacteria)]
MTSKTYKKNRLIVAGLSAALMLAGCSSSGESTDATAGAATGDGAFPATAESVYGPVTVESKPERIVATGSTVAAIMVALGEQPILIGEDAPDPADYPWLDGVFTGEFEDIWTDAGTSLELIAGHDPDLILNTGSFEVDEGIYPDYEAIAPTFVGTQEGISPANDLLLAYGKLVGKEAEAQKTLDDLNASFDPLKEGELAGLQGKTYNYVSLRDGAVFNMPNGSAVEYFGLEPAANQDNSWSSNGISYENMREFQADVLFVGLAADEDRARLEQDPLFQNLPAVKSGSVIFFDTTNEPINGSVLEASPPAVDYMREELTPLLSGLGANTAA